MSGTLTKEALNTFINEQARAGEISPASASELRERVSCIVEGETIFVAVVLQGYPEIISKLRNGGT